MAVKRVAAGAAGRSFLVSPKAAVTAAYEVAGARCRSIPGSGVQERSISYVPLSPGKALNRTIEPDRKKMDNPRHGHAALNLWVSAVEPNITSPGRGPMRLKPKLASLNFASSEKSVGNRVPANGGRKLGSGSPRTRCGIARLQLFADRSQLPSRTSLPSR